MFDDMKKFISENSKSRFYIMLESSHKEAMKRCEELVIDCLLFADKIHIWHLTCDTDKEHITLNSIYDKTRDYADSLAEILLGEGQSIAIHNKNTEFKPFETDSSYDEIKKFVDDLEDIATNPLDYSVSISDITKKYITDVTSLLGVATFK